MLRKKRLTRQVTVPVSAGLLTNVEAYFDALEAYRDGNPAPIVERLSEASLLAVANGRQLVAELKSFARHGTRGSKRVATLQCIASQTYSSDIPSSTHCCSNANSA